jgi:collagen type VII alpha
MGATGATGSTGSRGAIGATGASGASGVSGASGATGATGPRGPRGPRGARGVRGVRGVAGTKGATGATGAAGPNFLAGGSGSNPLPALTGDFMYLGFDSQSLVESNVWHIVPVNMTFGHFYCAGPKSSNASMTFTVDVTSFSGGVATTTPSTLSCVISSGRVSGKSGGSVTNPTTSGGVSWGLAP